MKNIDKFGMFQILYLIAMAILIGFILLGNAESGMDFSGMRSKADRLRIVSEKIEKHVLMPSKYRLPEKRLEELRLEGIKIIGDNEQALWMWESVFNLLKSDIPLAAGIQLGYIDAKLRYGSSPVGADLHAYSIPIRRGYD